MNKILFILFFILVKVVLIILIPFKILLWLVECLEAIINAILNVSSAFRMAKILL